MSQRCWMLRYKFSNEFAHDGQSYYLVCVCVLETVGSLVPQFGQRFSGLYFSLFSFMIVVYHVRAREWDMFIDPTVVSFGIFQEFKSPIHSTLM